MIESRERWRRTKKRGRVMEERWLRVWMIRRLQLPLTRCRQRGRNEDGVWEGEGKK